MATKKAKAKTENQALVLRKQESTALAVENKALREELSGLRAEIKDMQTAMIKLAERQGEVVRVMTEAPPPLFTYAATVSLLRDHEVLLVELEVENTGRRDLDLGTLTVLDEGGTPCSPMSKDYRADVELEGDVQWAAGGDCISCGRVQTFVWAFENGDGVKVSICVRIGGVEVVETKDVVGFSPDRPPSRRAPPKLLPAANVSTVHQDGPRKGLQIEGSEPKSAPANDSLWRR